MTYKHSSASAFALQPVVVSLAKHLHIRRIEARAAIAQLYDVVQISGRLPTTLNGFAGRAPGDHVGPEPSVLTVVATRSGTATLPVAHSATHVVAAASA